MRGYCKLLGAASIMVLAACGETIKPTGPTMPRSTAATDVEPGPEGVAANDPAAHANTIKWSTASEVDNFGYDVFRGESEQGPFIKLNDEPIPGAGTSDDVSEYQFIDDSIDPYEVYWYYVESISMNGVRTRFTPIFPSKPKLTRRSP